MILDDISDSGMRRKSRQRLLRAKRQAGKASDKKGEKH